MALDVATACYEPSVVEYVPGLANSTCDMLSRKFQPGKAFQLPALLADVQELVLPLRTASFYKTLSRPPLVPKDTVE